MSAADADPSDVGAPAPDEGPRDVAVPDEVVRLALELAFGVAVLGARQRPPLPVPNGLRPFLRFQKLPPAALGPLRRAVEADDAFRERVGAVADASVVGAAGSLWLRRPEGWQAELAALVAGDGDGDAGDDGRDRRDAVRLERAERAAARATAEAAAAQEALAAERARQSDYEADLAELRREVSRATDGQVRAEAAQAAAERRRVDADAARREAENRARTAEAERDDARRRLGALEEERHALQSQLAELTCRLSALEAARPPVTAPPPAPRRDDELSHRVAPLLGDAARTVARLAEVLDRLGQAIDGAETVAPPVARPRPVPSPPPAPPAAPRPPVVHRPHVAAPAARATRPARQPVKLPHRVRAESAEAATYLLRRPGAVVLVDGYNLAKVAFPAARSLADERDWLADVLDELAARTSADVRVVFDGADVPPSPARRRAVQVLFSPAGVTADDVLVDLTSAIPPERPVVVVTDDLALRERVKAHGANVLSDGQLLSAARR